VFFNKNSTNRRLERLEQELDTLKSAFRTMSQDWDATSDRVTKVLRRLRLESQRREEADAATDGEGSETLPLTSVVTPPDRMTRIRQQLAGRKEGT